MRRGAAEWGGSLSWLSLSLARGGRSWGREKSRDQQLGCGKAGDALEVPRFCTSNYHVGRGVSILQPLPQEALSRSPSPLEMWVENEGEGRREPLGNFRPQTLPLWECVWAEQAQSRTIEAFLSSLRLS